MKEEEKYHVESEREQQIGHSFASVGPGWIGLKKSGVEEANGLGARLGVCCKGLRRFLYDAHSVGCGVDVHVLLSAQQGKIFILFHVSHFHCF